MKKTKKIIFFLSMFLIFHTSLRSQNFFSNYDIIQPSNEYAYSVWGDGINYSIAGVSNSSTGAGNYDWMYTKLSSSGTVLCSRLIGFSNADSCFSHFENTNYNYIVLAGLFRDNAGEEKASFVRLNRNNCNFESRYILNQPLNHQFRQVIQAGYHDSIMLTGYIEHYNGPNDIKHRIMIAYSTTYSSMQWIYKYNPPSTWVDEKAFSITFQPTDYSYAVCGVTNRFTGPGGQYQAFVMKISANGDPLWFRIYSPSSAAQSEARKIIAMQDGGFVVTGFSTANDPLSDVYVFRINSTGGLIWSNTYGVPGKTEQSYSITFNGSGVGSDTSLTYTGYEVSSGTEKIIISRINYFNGSIYWTKVHPNVSGSNSGYDIKGSNFVAGKFYNTSNSSLLPFLMTTDLNGNVTSGCLISTNYNYTSSNWSMNDTRTKTNIAQNINLNPIINNPQVNAYQVCGTVSVQPNTENPNEFTLNQNYPNPFNPSTQISFYLPESGNVILKVFDATGQEVGILINGYKSKGTHNIEFDASSLSGGVYFYKLTFGEFQATKKMLLIK